MHEGMINQIDIRMTSLQLKIEAAEKEIEPLKEELNFLSDCRRIIRGIGEAKTRQEQIDGRPTGITVIKEGKKGEPSQIMVAPEISNNDFSNGGISI